MRVNGLPNTAHHNPSCCLGESQFFNRRLGMYVLFGYVRFSLAFCQATTSIEHIMFSRHRRVSFV
ncbi:hypothetical protein PALB_23660 [Pseudoalteromonas luteoviolacea B = ATCC 29581]|nr:hypothetical protein PALB_23660 [Pseudoalteromonas luteoviolacea B = ATCC 29581]